MAEAKGFTMKQTATLKDVYDWAVARNEAAESIRCLLKIPARLGLIDSDLGSLPATISDFERHVAGVGYAMVGSPKNIDENGRRMDARIRALLKRFWAEGSEAGAVDVRRRWTALMSLIEAEEGKPGSGKRWNIGRHRSLSILRSRATMPPEALTQVEIDRIGREVSADKRKALRKSVAFLNALGGLTTELPALVPFMPGQKFASPAGSARARKVDWQALPEAFRASFEAAADTCLNGAEALAQELLARIEAGEDPEGIAAEADLLAQKEIATIGKPTAAREQYRQAIVWLLRSFEDRGGDPAGLTDIGELFSRPIIEGAILDQIERSQKGTDLKDPLVSTTLPARLTSLTTIAKRGLKNSAAVVILKLLGKLHYDGPRKRLKLSEDGGDVRMIVDQIVDSLRQKPDLISIWCDSPRMIADRARYRIQEAQAAEDRERELTGLRLFAGAVAFAIQLSRPLRTACLRHVRIASSGEVHNNLLRTAPSERMYTFRFAPWEIKNTRWINVDVVGSDAAVLREWLEIWRPRMLELKKIESIYLFPGEASPEQDGGNPVNLPIGCYAPSSFLDLWKDAGALIGFDTTPHRMRHIVALSILTSRPGDYARVASVLGNTEAVCREHYGRDDGQAAARESRAAMIAQHPSLFRQLKERHAREQ